jgi:hypothetical protein
MSQQWCDSSDQTTRLWAPWTQESEQKDIVHPRWFEIARPQVHGITTTHISSSQT